MSDHVGFDGKQHGGDRAACAKCETMRANVLAEEAAKPLPEVRHVPGSTVIDPAPKITC